MSPTARDGLPPGSSAPPVIQGMGFWLRPLSYFERNRARFGKRFTTQLPMFPPSVVLTDPDDLKAVFTAPPDVLHPGEGALVLEPVVGKNSILLLDEDAHMEQRKLMLPSFHGEKMARLEGLMAEVAEREVADWPRDTAIELHPRMQALTLEIILRAAFGLEPGPRLDALRERLGALLAFGDKAISMLAPRNPDGLPAKILTRVGPFARYLGIQEESDALLFELIDERRIQQGTGAEQSPGDDILAMLLEARHEDGSPMSDEELRDELVTLLVAGHETTASTLAWAFTLLPRHPEIVRRLTEELDAGEEDAYLTATIQETLRHRPVLPNAAPRLVKQTIEIGGWTYPPGVCLIPNAYLLHHDPDIYPDPYTFRPERFVDEPPGTYTWIPFGGGRRRCLGASFAMLEMKLVLQSVLRACELRPAGQSEVARRRNITVRPAGGATVTLGERSSTSEHPRREDVIAAA